jgi:DNA-binding transcriptional ArsR family regulator
METVHLDTRTLKALAHPLRMRLLEFLRTHGPATATELARRAGETTSGTTSWHLRRLAEHGLVREVAEQSNGRERRWEAAHQRTNFDTATMLAPVNRVASVEFLHHVLDAQVQWIRAWLAQMYTEDPAWVDAFAFHDRLLRLTPERLAALKAELRRVLDAYQEEESDEDATGARQVAVVLHAFPKVDELAAGPAPGRLR